MTDESKPKLLVLIGPTAVGKTKMSIELAKEFGCEIISGDSMQVYRGMDIGTAKISADEMEGIPHHLIDIHEPDHPYSVAEFQEQSRRLITEIAGRGKLPFIVGGTGLYVESVCYGYQFSETGADEAFRDEQFRYANENGAEALHRKLADVDPETANRLHPNDLRRVVRALEVFHMTGIPLSAQLAPQTKQSPYDLCLVGLTMDRQMLYNRIEERIDLMLNQGLVDEVAALMDKGYAPGLVSMQGLGYKEIVSHLNGEFSYEEAVVLLKRDTRRFAKRQLSWFRHMKDIEWVDVTDSGNFSANYQKIRAIIAGKFH
ncbi:tRNA (adenosine(37)-N6)-dimethylallyltransferase MiaA [Paenibacillus glucanolyticus]|uniref:tRNA (adenosine(37)-N6)-dimethylallyltransferase MiaA n=1 Tax=Paenibacillus TaxID=44249 RepID=UPI0003E2154A|nr:MULTISPECIES: tRNA (adenosine(37)-N6)-dimethylallyltransferase MiaA [Paenibacillus]ANA82175.1 tRNA (adenosine(37)-N6)-dimethylallyltransferase MiaA [Paenibacillus glucanolyticus]AVV59088.1 tRNA (adenosine(37)-N6)-dimethylallyltransferase MiaA [Paenibacillus glucanolyticus]ETT42663.1 tRNA delta(2)-isopentenylpyrophosphate transferase [Paenibacillus sp. FSL R5-808]OMF67156.1 tRNA (adenosine(37)-N6)-dimethylallyltransferase MiaA [Paenibacillus glucanolyticus]